MAKKDSVRYWLSCHDCQYFGIQIIWEKKLGINEDYEIITVINYAVEVELQMNFNKLNH